MNPTYNIYLLTFFVFPVLGLVISRLLNLEKSKKYLGSIFLLLAIHNILFYFGVSIKGDYPDYMVFSLEYLFFSLIICLLYKSTSGFSMIARILGTLVLFVGFIQGLFGILMFTVISQDYETDKIYYFNSNNKEYQTRRYSFGFTTLIDTKYTFETYREYNYLPIEKLINKTNLFELNSDLDFSDNNFTVNIIEIGNKKILEFSSTNCKKFTSIIE